MGQKKLIQEIYMEINETIEELRNLKNNIEVIDHNFGDPALNYKSMLKINRDKTHNQMKKVISKINTYLYKEGVQNE